MSGIFTKRRKLNPVFFLYCCLSVFPLAFTLNPNKCLKDKAEVIPKKYPHYMGYQTEVIVETSNRVLHKLNTEIFKIFLEEVLGFARIRIVQEDDDFQLETIVDRLSPPVTDENVTFPTAMINLEVWVPPEYDTMNIEDVRLIKECGSIAPPGRFGWFIPMKLDMPVKQYYKRLTKNIQAVQEVHWTFLRDRDVVSAFDIDRVLMTKIVEPASKINDKEYYCMEKPCKRGMYIPSWCENDACAVLLTGHHNATKFVVDHIKELHLFVKVIWLGSNLKHITETLTNRTSPYKSIMVLHWTPSDVILREKNYVSVAFKHCELLNSTKSVGCKYELNRLVKFAWSKLETLDKLLFQAIRSFKFDEKDFSFLLTLYENNSNTDLAELACMWMKQSESTWSGWKQDSDMTKIYIGGIFPITGSSYNGIGIVRGALMAKNIINNNPDILPDYRLELMVANGRCRPDGVMKSFIDYIVDGYYNNLIGVLGPACSDTVEPLAGVSKHYRIMVISYSAEGASFSDRLKYPYFFRTIGENKHYKHVYLQLFKKLGWKRIAALTEDGQKYTEYISHMQELLEENDVEIISNTKFPREKETFNMARYLEDLKRKRARIIILDVYDEIARTVMCEAYRLKMTSADGYVWFLPNWLNDTWYHTDYYNDYNHETVNCTTGEMIKAITGYFSMAHAFWAPDEAMVKGNMTVTEWKRAYENLTARSFRGKSGSYHDEMSNYAGFAYDAVWTYALALDKLIKMDPEAVSDIHSESTTNKLVQLVKDTDFNGVSGRIKFRGGPSRFSVIHLMEWYDNSSHIVGQFFPNLTDDTPEILGGQLNLNVTALKWFTPKRDIPMDGTEPPPSCTLDSLAKFFNVSCEMAVVILNVILLSFLMVFVMVTIFTIRYKYAKKVKITQKYMKHLGLDVLLCPTAISDLDKWEIPRNSVVINRKLGEGAFGTVYGGEANLPEKGWVAVAVKTLKVGSNTEEKLDFLSEAEVMKRFDHKNIVKLLGVCTKEEPVYTIMEFMLYGDLKTFLLARRHLVNNKSVDESDEISSKKLTGIAVDVARGLSYLAELKYVHRDVASRNCLINAQRVVKLGDFGMTRPMVSNDYYKFTRKGMLPVRWMSPESLDVGKFTTASDVWSYGVLLYEIITFGSFPYQGMSNHQVLEYVKAGNTLSIPKGVKPQLEGLLKNCWHRDPKVRPRASEIVEFLANNPRLLAPCLDVPLASVQLEDPLEISLPDQFRKCSTTNVKNSPSIPNGISTYSVDERIPNERPKDLMPDGGGGGGMPVENCCPKEPLLGTARSSSSLLNFGKFVTSQHGNRESPSKRISRSRDEEDDEESDYVAHNTANTFAVSKV